MSISALELLHNYEKYGDTVVINNGKIDRIIPGKKNTRTYGLPARWMRWVRSYIARRKAA